MQAFRQALRNSSFAVGVIPGDPAVGSAMEDSRDVSALNEPASQGGLLRVIDGLGKVKMSHGTGRGDGKALFTLDGERVQEAILEIPGFRAGFAKQLSEGDEPPREHSELHSRSSRGIPPRRS